MEYRQLPHGNENEKFSVIGLGLGGIGTTPPDEMKQSSAKPSTTASTSLIYVPLVLPMRPLAAP